MQAYSGPRDMDATGQNMCEYKASQLDDRWEVYYGAMNQADWNAAGGKNGICGRCIKVQGVSGETTPGFAIKDVYVKIVDQCPDWACDKGNVDFSTTALKAITGFSWDKKLITWEYVNCPDDTQALVSDAKKDLAAAKAAYAKAKDAYDSAQKAAEKAATAADTMQQDGQSGAAIQAAAREEAVAQNALEELQRAADKAEAAVRDATKRVASVGKGRKML